MSTDAHKTTSRLAAKAAKGDPLTPSEQAEMDQARAEIMDRPDVRAFEAAVWAGMAAEAQIVKIEMETALAKLQAKIDAEAREESRP